MSISRVLAAACLLASTGLAGCQSASHALGLAKITPDEFRVVSKAPLVLPPDYSLRPPSPGEPRPQELEPQSAARAALLGQREAQVRSDGEKLFVAKAGGDKADPLVRYVVDDETGAVAHKDKGFADWVLFWHKGQPGPEPVLAAAAETGAPLDAAAEQKRITSLTGDQPIVIARQGSGRVKLPGL